MQYAWAAPGVYPVDPDRHRRFRHRLGGVDDEHRRRRSAPRRSPTPGPDQSVAVSEVAFDGGGSHDADGAITSYEWSFGDGATASGPQRPARLRPVRHLRGGARRARRQRRAAQHRPRHRDRARQRRADRRCRPRPDRRARRRRWCSTAPARVDPDGEVADWLWRFPDGSEAEGERVARAFADPGLQRVLLTVRDDTGLAEAFDVDEVTVAVNAPPVAVAGPDLLVAPGDPVRLDGSASFDPDGTIAAWRWDFDDLDAPVAAPVAERTFEARACTAPS